MPHAERWGRHLLLGAAVVVMLLPIVWALGASFKPFETIFDLSPVPVPATLDNYRAALDRLSVGRLLLNTLVMALGVTAAGLLLAIPAAYALVRFDRARGRAFVLAAVGLALLVPPQALVVPQFLMTTRLGWQGTAAGLIVPQLGTSALAVLLLRDQIRAIPRSVIDAAVLDGARPGEILRHVVLGLLRPALAAVGILIFINTWNEYLWPLLVAPRAEDRTVQPGLAQFVSPENPQYGPLLAASVLASLPVVAAYLVASRRVTDAFLHSGAR